jgi:hypothetical protein
MFERGPYLNAALICEKILREGDGTLSPIRIIDRFTMTIAASGPVPGELPRPVATFALFVSLRGGEARGTYNLQVRVERPDGLLRELIATQVLIEPGERAMNFVADLTLGFEIDGLYWFHIMLDDQPITRTPLRVLSIVQQFAPQAGGPSPFV